MNKKSKSSKSDTERESTTRNKEKLLKVLEAKLGVVSDACKSAKISRDTHYRWMAEDPEYKKKVIELEDVALDAVESEMHKQIKKGDASLIRFYMKTKGRKRGYIEKQEILFDVGPKVENIEWRITSKKKLNGVTQASN